MSNFSYYTPTHVYFGKDTHKQVGDLVRAQLAGVESGPAVGRRDAKRF